MKSASAFLTLSLLLPTGTALSTIAARSTNAAGRVDFEIVGERTHFPEETTKGTNFTQGLLIRNGRFYESTGMLGSSILKSYPVTAPADSSGSKSGTTPNAAGGVASVSSSSSTAITRHAQLDRRYFGEGLAYMGGYYYQLTWKLPIEDTSSHEIRGPRVFVWKEDSKRADFTLAGSFFLPSTISEGWGLTSDGKQLILSDGSDQIYFLSVQWKKENGHAIPSAKVSRTIRVQPKWINLNELEWVKNSSGEALYANVWMSQTLLKIDPKSGKVLKIFVFMPPKDFPPSLLWSESNPIDAVLNGIAFEAKTGCFYLTGKNWPKMYKVRLEGAGCKK